MYSDCQFIGPLFTPGFVTHGLPALLSDRRFDPDELHRAWRGISRGFREFASTGGPNRVLRHIIGPLSAALGYGEPSPEDLVSTREGPEDGGHLLRASPAVSIRTWPIGSDIALDLASKRGSATRVSPMRRANRVLRALGEPIGIVTNGETLRILVCEPGGPESQIVVPLSGRSGWAGRSDPPESFLLTAAIISARTVTAINDVFDASRLHQSAVTKTLRGQARSAIENFLQCIIDNNGGAEAGPAPAILWRQALTIVYRLLFILQLESSIEPAGGFSFTASETWCRAFSPNRALGPLVRRHLDLGHDTGRMLEDGVRLLFRICREGFFHSSLSMAPLGGGLFDPAATETLDGLIWGERAVALLLDHLMWTMPKGRERERVHYGSLGVEELGRVYEVLLELEPDIATRPMVRVRRGRLETVVDAAPFDTAHATTIEHIPVGRFFLRSGLGRRSGGSYYTPHDLVRFLVRETLNPLAIVAAEALDPTAVLRIKVLDPAMGSGHFLVEACRFLANVLYEICCGCDALGTEEARRAIESLPDPDRRLLSYMPSHSRDQSDSGPSRARALAICRRLVTVHCLYGVDQDALAVELAKLSLWLESFAEGLPLTFLDHRLLVGDSISGPFFRDLSRLPVGGAELDSLLAKGVTDQLHALVGVAMNELRALDGSIGSSIADIIAKQAAKDRLDSLLAPLRGLARAWSGAVRISAREANDAWLELARTVADTGKWPESLHRHQAVLLTHGASALPLDVMFPEVFRPDQGNGGFHAVLGNPPWDVIHYQTKEYLAKFDPRVMEAPTRRERGSIERHLLKDPDIREGFANYKTAFVERKHLCDRLFGKSGSSGSVDLFQTFTERMLDCVAEGGAIGIVVPSSFHANEGTTRLRRRVLGETSIESCFTFENRKRLFDIHGRQKFTLLVARRTQATAAFQCAFYLDSIGQLNERDRIMVYDRDFIAATGGDCDAFLELRGQTDLRVARHMFVDRPHMRTWLTTRRMAFGREAHMTDDSHRFTPIAMTNAAEALPLHEGKTFHQYSDSWKTPRRYALCLDAIRDKPAWLRASKHYRLAFREISRSTDERTMIAAIVPPGYVFGHKGTCERTPWQRPDASALILCAVFNSFAFDWCVRKKIAASVSLFMLNGCPAPTLSPRAATFLAHGALRLSSRHVGYARLWREQIGAAYPFSDKPMNDDERDTLRAAIDAVVAQAYGLGRADYHHILSDFSHRLHPRAPDLCRGAFDALAEDGDRTFHQRYDPFTDVPLVDDPPQPEIASPIASATLMPSIAAERMPPA